MVAGVEQHGATPGAEIDGTARVNARALRRASPATPPPLFLCAASLIGMEGVGDVRLGIWLGLLDLVRQVAPGGGRRATGRGGPGPPHHVAAC